MRKIFLLLLLLPMLTFGQGVKFSALPIFTRPLSDSDKFVGTHINPNGSTTVYQFTPVASIIETILGVTYSALDSGLATRMNALTIKDTNNNTSDYTVPANQFTRVNTSGNFTIKLPSGQHDRTLEVVEIDTLTNPLYIKKSSTAFDTLFTVGHIIAYQYDSANNKWTHVWGYLPTSYVNNAVHVSNQPIAVAAIAATATPLVPTATYSNGVNGIGATLTGTSNAHLVTDGYSANVGDRILVDDQSPAAQNGEYIVTITGTPSVAHYVLTRCDNYNQPGNINNTGLIPVSNGTVNAGTAWALTTNSIATVGTDAINYTKIAGPQTLDNTITNGKNTNQIVTAGKVNSTHPYGQGRFGVNPVDSSMFYVAYDSSCTDSIKIYFNPSNGGMQIYASASGFFSQFTATNGIFAGNIATGHTVYLNPNGNGVFFGDGNFNQFLYFSQILTGNINDTLPARSGTVSVEIKTQTAVSGSTSGSATFIMPFQQPGYKKVMINCAALLGTATYTFPTAFANTPVIPTTNGLSASLVTTLNTTTVTVTGATSTGLLIIEGY